MALTEKQIDETFDKISFIVAEVGFAGLLQAFSLYLQSYADDPIMPPDTQEKEDTLTLKGQIDSCMQAALDLDGDIQIERESI